jgi:hypothetical protein
MAQAQPAPALIQWSCQLAEGAGFAYATDVSDNFGVVGVTRVAAGNYTITTLNPCGTSGAIPIATFMVAQPVAGATISLTNLTATTWQLTTATGGALADIGRVFVAVLQKMT